MSPSSMTEEKLLGTLNDFLRLAKAESFHEVRET